MNRMGHVSRGVLRVLCIVAAVGLSSERAGGEADVIRLKPDEITPWAQCFVQIRFHFKQSEQKVDRWEDPWDFSDEMESPEEVYEGFLDMKRPYRQFGIIIAPDTVITPDVVLEEEYLDRIEVEDSQGHVGAAERSAILQNAPGLLLHIMEPRALVVTSLDLAVAPEVSGPDVALAQVWPNAMADSWLLNASHLEPDVRIRPGGQAEMVLQGLAGPADLFGGESALHVASFSWGAAEDIEAPACTLLLNRERKPLGIGLTGQLILSAKTPPLWQGRDLASDTRMEFPALQSQLDAVKKKLEQSLLEIRIAFRQKAQPGDAPGTEGWFGSMVDSFSGLDSEEVPTERFYYGLRVAPRMLLVPARIERQHAKLIDVIEVHDGEKIVQGTFVGMFEDMAAFLVSVNEELAAPAVAVSQEELQPSFQPLVSVVAQHRFGGKWLDVNYTRAVGIVRGYKDVVEPRMLGVHTTGTLFADLDGTLRGVLLQQRKEGQEKRMLRHETFYDYSPFSDAKRVYAFKELAERLAEPAPYLDKTIMALSEEEQSRRMWLGVEFQPMTKELAKTLEVEKPTKDGSIGLVVSVVYPGSPAEALGLKTGDILLRLVEPGDPEPAELRMPPSFDEEFDFSQIDLPPFMETLGMKTPPKKPWKSRDNVLTRLLEVIGEGNDVALAYLADGKELKTASFTVALAPLDFDSAAKLEDEALGLTVKPVTYEIRYALQVPEGSNAVVVAKVEEGSPAAVAKIREYELIVKANDTDVNGIDGLKQIVETARAQEPGGGKATLRFTVQSLGKTRIADVALK